MPQSPLTGNRFLITTYKFGGESNFAKLVPLKNDSAPENSLEYWWNSRPSHRYGIQSSPNELVFDEATVLAALANKLGTTPDYALHPNYNGIMPVWAAGDLAIVPSCGVMEDPLPDDLRLIPNYQNLYRYPMGIGAHNQFQRHHIYMNGRGEQSSAGWIGKVMDAAASTNELSTGLSGLHTLVIRPATPHFEMHKGNTVIPFTIPRLGPSGPSSGTAGISVALSMPVSAVEANVRTKLLEAINLAADPASVRHSLWKNAVTSAVQGSSVFAPVQSTLVGGGGPLYAVDASFGQITDKGWWYSMFHRLARIVEVAITLKSGSDPIRMALGASIGDYDTHGSEKERFEGNITYTSLAQQYGDGLAAFRTAMIAIGAWDDCVITDPTDFGRTLWTQGGLGTDHAWAYTMFIAGGLVRGQGKDGSTGLLGPYPPIISTVIDGTRNGTRDWNKGGIMYPYRSLEEVYDQILDWFGMTTTERNAIMPNRTRFSNFIDVLDI